MKESIESGRLSMDIIDQAVRRVLTQKFELGLFENPYPDLEKLKKYLHLKSADELNEKLQQKVLHCLKMKIKHFHFLRKLRKSR